jgi:hypothetical protein
MGRGGVVAVPDDVLERLITASDERLCPFVFDQGVFAFLRFPIPSGVLPKFHNAPIGNSASFHALICVHFVFLGALFRATLSLYAHLCAKLCVKGYFHHHRQEKA